MIISGYFKEYKTINFHDSRRGTKFSRGGGSKFFRGGGGSNSLFL